MRLLVVGVDRVDAGKTTFSVGLADRTDAVGFKPRAANDYWFDHDDYLEAVSRGRLYGTDAERLAAVSPDGIRPEEINPLHRLWRPLPGSDTGLIGPGRRQFVCDRIGPVGIDSPGWPAAGLVANPDAGVPEPIRRRLPFEDAVEVRSVEALNGAMTEYHTSVLSELGRRIHDADRAVIESYADVARPIEDVSVDAVAAVEPGRARIYDGERYERACSVASSSPRDGRLERSVEDVVDPLDPVASVDLPPLSDSERTDPVAIRDAYEVAYDALIGAAVG